MKYKRRHIKVKHPENHKLKSQNCHLKKITEHPEAYQEKVFMKASLKKPRPLRKKPTTKQKQLTHYQ